MPDFLPRRDADLLAWSSAFDSNIHNDPESFGLSFAQAAEYRTLHLAFAEAYRAAVAPGERTGPAIKMKDAARAAVKACARRLAPIAKSSPQSAVLNLLGQHGGRRKRHGPPEVAPLVHVVAREGADVTINLRDPGAPTRPAMPRGVDAAVLFTHVGDEPPQKLEQWDYRGMTSRMTARLAFLSSLEPGTRVWIAAQWSSTTSGRGPASTPCGTWIAGGAMRVRSVA